MGDDWNWEFFDTGQGPDKGWGQAGTGTGCRWVEDGFGTGLPIDGITATTIKRFPPVDGPDLFV